MDWKSTLLQGSSVLVPLLWSQFGPLAIRFLTGLANHANRYVPREWQVVLSAVLGALASAMSVDGGMVSAVSSVGGATVTGLGAVAGIVSQKLAGADPKWMKTSAPE